MAIESLQNHCIFNYFFPPLFGQILPIKKRLRTTATFKQPLNSWNLHVGQSLLFHYLVFVGLA
jgi:hypothetical protein